jgi:hypothetical protein
MNAITRTLTGSTAIVAIAAAAFGTFGTSAYAQEATYEYPQAVVSQKTRAQVHAELLQARAEGTLLVSEADFNRTPSFVASKSREMVVAELRADAGVFKAVAAEPQGFDAPKAAPMRQGTVRVIAAR